MQELHAILLALAILGQDTPIGHLDDSDADPIDRAHWSFQALRRPAIPESPPWRTANNPIDQFILARLAAAGLSPTPAASRITLIRRLTFNLTGLPPSPQHIESFVADPRPDAYERLVDRLLAAPSYGERWAQHWLDIARFAETDGFEHDLVRPNAWRYRDWVIDALNADMPYDEFLRMQLAGDELALVAGSSGVTHGIEAGERPSRSIASSAVATGFLLCGPDMPDLNLQDERRHNVLNEMTSTVGSVFLGLQFGCAQCHDHKFDPISMADFYRLRAFFEPSEFFDEAPLATPSQLAERERLETPIKAERERLDNEFKKFDATAHERLNKDPQVKISRDEIFATLSETERERFQNLTEDLKRLNLNSLPAMPMARMLREKGGTPRASHVMVRGNFRQQGARVNPAYPRIANLLNDPVEITASVAPSSGRRTALANWLARSDHSLTSRVIVNRVWQFHFGQALVRTPSDFGKMGETPTHPELLDWLAGQFARPVAEGGYGWSLKRLHKLVVTSATYMQASRPTELEWTDAQRAAASASWNESILVDPENRLLARMNRWRLDGESIRDAMLEASGRLSLRRGGPGVRPPLPDELTSTLLKGQWVVTPDEQDHRRRSIYVFVRRNLRYPLFDAFDRPDTNASCPQRPRSTTAPQSLTLLNSDFTLESARALAGYALNNANAEAADQIGLCYLRTMARRPSPEEAATGIQFLRDQTSELKRNGRTVDSLAIPADIPDHTDPFAAAALTQYCLALFNLNEFVYVD
jgi:hypothetical protein